MSERELSGPFPEHPLFPVEDGVSPPEVTFIQITRRENGASVWGPVLSAEELQSGDDIVSRFGGGTYELIARRLNPKKPDVPGKISTRRLITLPGKPIPFSTNPTVTEKIAAGIIPDPHEPKPASAGGIMGDSGVLVAILQMGQQAAQLAQQQSMQFMTMFMQMMAEGKKESAESSRNMMQMFATMSQSQQQSMMTMVTALMQNRGGGPEEFAKYAELLKSLGAVGSPKREDDEEGEPTNVGKVIEDVADIVTGLPAALGALNGAKAQGGSAELPAPAGSALSVIRGEK